MLGLYNLSTFLDHNLFQYPTAHNQGSVSGSVGSAVAPDSAVRIQSTTAEYFYKLNLAEDKIKETEATSLGSSFEKRNKLEDKIVFWLNCKMRLLGNPGRLFSFRTTKPLREFIKKGGKFKFPPLLAPKKFAFPCLKSWVYFRFKPILFKVGNFSG